MELKETPDNPMPADPADGFVKTPDGVQLRYARWRTTRPPFRGTAILLQGRGEYIEKYYETIGNLRETGYDVLTFDWRGQGGSDRLVADRATGYVDSFDQYVTDLDTVLKAVALPDCRIPFHILAHSAGALVALLSAPGLANRVERLLLASPLLAMNSLPIPQKWLGRLAGAMYAFGLGSLRLQSGRRYPAVQNFPGNVLTSDIRRFTRNAEFGLAHPGLRIGPPSAAWIYAAYRAMKLVDDSDFIGSITIPVLLVCAGNDAVVANRRAEEMGRRLRSGRTLTVYGAKHEMFQERDRFREQLLAAFRAFTGGGEEAA